MLVDKSEIPSVIPGAGLSVALAFAALGVSALYPSLDALLISLVLGMFAANFLGKGSALEAGVRFCVSFVLPAGVGLYGSQLLLSGVGPFWLYVLGSGLLIFAITFLVARGFGLEDEMTLLLSAGLSTAGACAIAMVSGVLGTEAQDTSASIISVITVGLAGMLVFGFYPQGLGVVPGKLAFIMGATLPSLGMVTSFGAPLDPGAIRLAASFKLLRVVLLGILLLVISFKSKSAPRCRRFPWFMIPFAVLVLAVNLLGGGSRLSAALAPSSQFVTSVGLAAVGLGVELDSAPRRGMMPFATSLFAWGISVLFIYLVMRTL